MTSPDDLPRSPSGRIPQWVLDEAAGRTVDPTSWRTASPAHPALGTGGRTTRRQRRAARRAAGPSNRVTALIAVLVVATTLTASFAWASGQPGGLAGAWGSLGGDTSAAEEASRPPLGQEEAASPLGTPPAVTPSSGYGFLETRASDAGEQVPITWSPCRPIHFVIAVDRAPQDFIPQVGSVVKEVGEATGLQFVFDGLSDESPAQGRVLYQPERYGDHWAPLIFELADETQNAALAGDVAGLGSPFGVLDKSTGIKTWVSGSVQVDVTMLDVPPLGDEPAYLPVLRHELGHVMGLRHVTDDRQIMFPTTNLVTDYQDGDLAGLAALGSGPCAAGV